MYIRQDCLHCAGTIALTCIIVQAYQHYSELGKLARYGEFFLRSYSLWLYDMGKMDCNWRGEII